MMTGLQRYETAVKQIIFGNSRKKFRTWNEYGYRSYVIW